MKPKKATAEDFLLIKITFGVKKKKTSTYWKYGKFPDTV